MNSRAKKKKLLSDFFHEKNEPKTNISKDELKQIEQYNKFHDSIDFDAMQERVDQKNRKQAIK